jgi:hypothetical protein
MKDKSRWLKAAKGKNMFQMKTAERERQPFAFLAPFCGKNSCGLVSIRG